MDTITHGVAGALIGKALCSGDSMLPPKPMSRARIITWVLMLGAIFPDSDVLRDIFSRNDLLMITWHRSLTHSLLMMPIFSLLFIPGTFAIAAIARIVGAPISTNAIWVAIFVFSALFLLPAFRGWGSQLSLATWNRAGFAAGCLYLALAVFAHHNALERIKK